MSRPFEGARAALAVAALASILSSLPTPAPASEDDGVWVSIENQSQYTLDELRAHRAPVYLDAPNVLTEPLPVGASTALWAQGAFHLTFIRERYAGGPSIAFTTARPIDPTGQRALRVEVFDESFRVHGEPEPDAADGGCACSTARATRPSAW